MPPPYDYEERERNEVLREARIIEHLASEIYGLAQVELNENSPEDAVTLYLLQTVLDKAFDFTNEVERSYRVHSDTVDELIELQLAMNEVQARVWCGTLSEQIREDFMEMQDRMRELLIRYNVDLDILDEPSTIAEGLLSLQCERFTLREERVFDSRDTIRPIEQVARTRPNKLVFEAVMVNKQNPERPVVMPPERFGVARLTIINVFYTDGSLDPLVTRAIERRDPRRVGGELELFGPGDKLVLDVDPNREIASIDIIAYSTVDPDHSVKLNVHLAREIGPLPDLPR